MWNMGIFMQNSILLEKHLNLTVIEYTLVDWRLLILLPNSL